MKAIIGSITGGLLGLMLFAFTYYDAITSHHYGLPNLIRSIHLGRLESEYMWGGAIIGAIIGLAFSSKTKND